MEDSKQTSNENLNSQGISLNNNSDAASSSTTNAIIIFVVVALVGIFVFLQFGQKQASERPKNSQGGQQSPKSSDYSIKLEPVKEGPKSLGVDKTIEVLGYNKDYKQKTLNNGVEKTKCLTETQCTSYVLLKVKLENKTSGDWVIDYRYITKEHSDKSVQETTTISNNYSNTYGKNVVDKNLEYLIPIDLLSISDSSSGSIKLKANSSKEGYLVFEFDKEITYTKFFAPVVSSKSNGYSSSTEFFELR
jgi:hypothetical protein